MAIYLQSSYKLKTDDDLKVSLLSMCIGNLNIDSMTPNGGVPFQGRKIKDLPDIIAQIKLSMPEPLEITLKTTYSPEESLSAVFPKFQPNTTAIPIPSHLQFNVHNIALHFNYHKKIHVGEVHIVPPKLNVMTQNEAWQVLHFVNQKAPITSALDLPKEKMIIGMHENKHFCLFYGNNCRLEDIMIGFDLDRGFIGIDQILDGVIQKSAMPLELNEAFDKWKQNNYIGPLFSIQNRSFKTKIKLLTDNKLTAIKNFLRAPTEYPFKSATIYGLIILACAIPSFPFIIALGVSTYLSLSAYVIINLRKQYFERAKKHLHVDKASIAPPALIASQKGYQAANSWTMYFKDFLTLDNWKHGNYYGAGMKKGLSDNIQGKKHVVQKYNKKI